MLLRMLTMSLLITCVCVKKPLIPFRLVERGNAKNQEKREKDKKWVIGVMKNIYKKKPVVWNVYWTLMSLCCLNTALKKKIQINSNSPFFLLAQRYEMNRNIFICDDGQCPKNGP